VPKNSSELRDLVSDAKRIIAYATRNGVILQPELLTATYRVEAHLANERELTNEDKIALITQLNLAANAIRPVTLIDLGSRWRPFSGGRNSMAVRAAVSVLAIAIIALAGYYTNVYMAAGQALAELTSIQAQAPADKAARLYRMYLHNPHLFTDIPGESDDLHYEPYLRGKEDLSNLDADILTTQTEVFRLDQRSNLFASLKSLWKKSSRPAQAAIARATTPVVASPAAAPSVKEVDAAAAPQAPDLPQSEEDFLIRIGAPNVATLVDPTYSASQSTLAFQVEKVRELVESLGDLVLPTLFGMIGTIVFELRRMLNPMAPNEAVERMIVRTALGGLAGLSITFILKPLHVMQDGAHAGMAVFAAAFLLGFSIDVFFSILDKLVTTLSQSIAGNPK
jgi:hypothetical protein